MNSIRTTRRSSPKVVSIPVQFIGSEEPTKPAAVIMTPAAAAVKVQKVFRGVLVRKSVKKIKSIRNEVDEIERRISRVEVVELLIKDPKERLRVNESLMALLFKLDSVRGVDSRIRDLRKAVIKKAIALQEKVDGIVAGDYQTLGTANNDSTVVEVENSMDCLINSETALDQAVKFDSKAGNQAVENVDCGSDIVSEEIKEAVTIENERQDEIRENSEEIVDQIEAESEGNLVEENCAVKEIDQNYDIVKDVSECLEESVETSYTDDYVDENSPNPPNSQSLIEEDEENCSKEGVESIKFEAEDTDDNKRNRDLLEKMMEDNEKMMKMMKQIFERNEQQTQMLNSLSHRVEQLEKAFVCDKMRRKKKRQL